MEYMLCDSPIFYISLCTFRPLDLPLIPAPRHLQSEPTQLSSHHPGCTDRETLSSRWAPHTGGTNPLC